MTTPDTKPQLSDLRALLALIKDGTVTSAASTLGVTQSTLSYQLDGMRKRFADQLFVRVGNRMAPTPFALQLVEPASRVLRIMDNEIADLAGFDPSTTEREFRLGVNEIGAMTLVPKLVRSLAQVAPRAKLVQMHLAPRSMAVMLENGDLDVVAGHVAHSNDNLIQRLIEIVRSFPELPLWMALKTALLPNAELAAQAPRLWPATLTLDNFRHAWAAAPFARYFANTTVLVLMVVTWPAWMVVPPAMVRVPVPTAPLVRAPAESTGRA
mgnify:CR=1 FL=1